MYSFIFFRIAIISPTSFIRLHHHAMIAADLQNKYGATLSPENRIDSEKLFDVYTSWLDEFIENDSRFTDHGVYTWAALRENMPLFNSLDAYDMFQMIYAMETNHALDRIITLENFFRLYDFYYDAGFEGGLDLIWDDSGLIPLFEPHIETLATFIYSDHYKYCPMQSVFPSWFVDTTTWFFRDLITIVIIAVGILILPIITRDRLSNMVDLQYSSKAGRRILRTQFAAMMVSSFALSAIIIGSLITVFLVSNAVFYDSFFNSRIASTIWNLHLPWFDITFMQFVGISFVISMAVAMAASMVLFFLSAHSHNYVNLLLKAIPVIVVMSRLGRMALYMPLMFQNPLYAMWNVIGIEFIASGVLLAIGIGLYIFTCKQALRKDL